MQELIYTVSNPAWNIFPYIKNKHIIQPDPYIFNMISISQRDKYFCCIRSNKRPSMFKLPFSELQCV